MVNNVVLEFALMCASSAFIGIYSLFSTRIDKRDTRNHKKRAVMSEKIIYVFITIIIPDYLERS